MGGRGYSPLPWIGTVGMDLLFGNATKPKSVEVAVLVVWMCTAVGTIITMPDNEPYWGRVEKWERLLRTHCSGWTLTKDTYYLPTHEY
jgi:hypothetical protein